MGEKEKQREKLSPSILLMEKIPYSACLGAFYSQTPIQITKKPKLKAITRDNFGRNQKKATKRSQRQTAGEVNSGWMGE